ncbi:MAG: hypothetical protein ACYTHM_04480 [Planctomycetota bacterium]
MNLDLRKTGRFLMVLNFVLTAGVVVAGADFFASPPEPRVNGRAFRDVVAPAPSAAEEKGIFRDYSGITATKFRTRGEAGRKKRAPVVRPGATSAVQNTLRVLGTMLSNNEAFNFAILEDIHTRKQHTVSVGDVVGSVKIVGIRAEEVEVLLHGEKTVLPLDLTVYVAEKKKKKKPSKSSRSRGSRNRSRGKPPSRGGNPPMPQRKQDSAKPESAGGNAPDPVSRYLANMSPKLKKWWDQLPPGEREKWGKWWLNKSPEERAKWEQKFTRIAKSGKDKITGIK